MAWVSGDVGSRNSLSSMVAIRYMWPFELKFSTVKKKLKIQSLSGTSHFSSAQQLPVVTYADEHRACWSSEKGLLKSTL